jgi:hypothetical protein
MRTTMPRSHYDAQPQEGFAEFRGNGQRDQEGDRNEGQRDGPLDEHGAAQEDIAPKLQSRTLLDHREHDQAHRPEQEQRESHVEDRVRAQGERGREHDEHHRGRGADGAAEYSLAKPREQDGESYRRKYGNAPGGELSRAEYGVRDDLEDVEERGFVQEGMAVERRDKPVAGLQHLATRLGVRGLVWIPEAGPADGPRQRRTQEAEQDGGRVITIGPSSSLRNLASPHGRKGYSTSQIFSKT